jgi:hypothetical protein
MLRLLLMVNGLVKLNIHKTMDNKKEYMVITSDGVYDYDVIVEDIEGKGTKYSIHMSHGEQYQNHAKGELVISMLDTGDDIVFSKPIKKLDYAESLCLRILLSIEHDTSIGSMTPLKYRVVENKQVLEV